MREKKIMIGGGAGYIGSVLVPYLIKKGYSVTVVDLLWFGNYLPKTTKVIKKNLFDISRKDMEGFDCFIFLGGVSNDPMANLNPKLNFLYNASLPAYLAYEAKNAGVKRFIYGSSCSVYGNIQDICTEETPPKTCDPYGISKLQGEQGVLSNQTKSFSTIIFRQGTVCGWSPRMRFDLAINTMVKTALIQKKIIVDNPTVWRPICDIDSLVRYYYKALKAKRSLSGVFNIADGNYQVLALAKLVKKHAESILHISVGLEIHKSVIIRNYRVSTKKVSHLFGNGKENTLDKLIKTVLIKSSQLKNISEDKYYNIKIFKKLV